MRLATERVYMFDVSIDANKKTVAQDIEFLYDVKPIDVRILKRLGKVKRIARTRKTTQMSLRKIAFVVVAKDKSIPGFEKILEVEETQNNED